MGCVSRFGGKAAYLPTKPHLCPHQTHPSRAVVVIREVGIGNIGPAAQNSFFDLSLARGIINKLFRIHRRWIRTGDRRAP